MYWYKLVVAYDGTDFFGWQQQDTQCTVEGTLKKTFLRVFKQQHVYLVGASRTDTGVHAQGQVVRIGTSLHLDPETCMRVLNNALPLTIQIISCHTVERAFHPQHTVAYKVYSYRIFTKRPCVYQQRYGYYFWHLIDMQKLHEALQIFVGTHDFSLCAKTYPERSTIRTINEITVQEYDHEIVIHIKGISFLQYMVRRIVGAALAIASDQERTVYELEQLLQGKRITSKTLPKAPAKGLCLESIVYNFDSNKEC